MKKYESIRKKLENKRDELINRLERIGKQPGHVQQSSSQNSAEQAVELARKDVVDALNELSHAELEKINRVLARMNENVYGICSVCGNDIDVKRIEVLPYTALCLSCAKKEGN